MTKLPANLSDVAKETITRNWAISPSGHDSFENIFDRLAATDFKATPVSTQRGSLISFFYLLQV
jgi:hypothetical protein